MTPTVSKTNYAMDDFWPLFRAIERDSGWKNKAFDKRKAYLCCLLAEMAYAELARNEIDRAGRLKFFGKFPSATFERAVRQRRHGVSANAFPQGPSGPGVGSIDPEFPRPEIQIRVAESRYFVSTIVHIPQHYREPPVTFVAIRGTADAYDLRVDLDRRLINPYPDAAAQQLELSTLVHRGFLLETLRHIELLQIHLNRMALADRPSSVYLTGHSLGGAIAGLIYALFSNGYTEDSIWLKFGHDALRHHLTGSVQIHSCYTFAAPRFTNEAGIKSLPSPFAIIRETDPVVYLPFGRAGYLNGLREYGTNLEANPRRQDRAWHHVRRWIINALVPGYFMVDHRCEAYRRDLCRAVGLKFNPELFDLSDARTIGF